MDLRPLLRKGLQFFSRHQGTISLVIVVFVSVSAIFGQVYPVFATGENTVLGATALGNMIITTLTWILNYIVLGLGKLILLLIEVIIVPILNYNSFSTSPIIGLGWSLVRDVMNMFVIVALIFIAIFTIVGNHRAHWEQQLPQLFIAVVLMNFSRTICGLLIDISQVIMFTFVNALLDIAAGNFTQMFQLNDFGKMQEAAIQASITSGEGITPFSQFIAAFLQIPLYGSIAAILFLLALAFLYRIVLLWILVILSPMAFFLGGIKGIFHGAEQSAGQWWGKFTGALMMGPILTFFLWLALAASSSGSISASEGFTPAPAGDTYFSVAALDSSHITSLLLALILLTVGMQVAGEQASKVGGLASQVINEGMGRKVVGGALTMPFTAARRAGGYVGSEIDTRYAPKGSSSIRESIGQGIIGAGQRVGLSSLPGAAYAGQAITGAGGKLELAGEHERGARRKAATDRVRGMSGANQVSALQMLTKGGNSGLGSPEADRALIAEYSANKKLREEAAHLGVSDEDRDSLLTMAMNTQREDESKGRLDDKEKDTFYKTQSENLHLMKKSDGTLDKEAVKKFVKSDDFQASKVSDTALKDPGVLEVLASEKDRSVKDKDVSYLDRFAAGKYKGRLTEENKAQANTAKTAEVFTQLKATAGPDALKEAFDDKRINVADVRTEDFQGAKGNQLAQALVGAKVNVDNLGAGSFDPSVVTDNPVRREFVNNVVSKQKAPVITSALSSGKVTLAEIKPTDFTGADTAQRFELTRGVIRADEQVKEEYMGTEARDAFATSVSNMKATKNISDEDATVAHGMLLRAGKPLAEVLPGVRLDSETPTFTKEDRAYTAQLIKADVGNVKYLEPAIKDATKSNAVTRVVVENTKLAQGADGKYKAPDVDKLAGQIGKSEGTTRTDLRQRLEILGKAVAIEHTRAMQGAAPTEPKGIDERKRIDDLHDQIQTTLRTLP
ncbi:MAG: hypothetical protein WC813_03665 [Patescibacteria group bacterium]|jgi:hypothetical protein